MPKGLRAGGRSARAGRPAGTTAAPARLSTGIAELDRVLGGGLVAGSAILIGGDPGIGKSTLVLQAGGRAGARRRGGRLRQRRGIDRPDPPARRASRAAPTRRCSWPRRPRCATSLGDLRSGRTRRSLLVDRFRSRPCTSTASKSAPGTVTQLRTSAHELIRFAKRRGTALFLVGHVTKDGQIAGPRVLEHMVDAVLYFEGERSHQFRILRAVKNRFGAANEIGVFEMAEQGLAEVPNPSALFLAEREAGVSGAAVFAGMEGSRPLLVEIQALVGPSRARHAAPHRGRLGRRAGWRCCWRCWRPAAALAIGGRDVYLNVAGGLRIGEPAADLAVAAALVSSLLDRPVPPAAVIFGEVGLAGEVRAVSQPEARLQEAAKLGFDQAHPAGRERQPGVAHAPGRRLRIQAQAP